ncbi:biotin--[acetyl-CoA-carboxylase] ligase [Alterisphingorhabdus coralli]|uniref:biotin--[biotin carboxyl-carrier protein] ligase n=1 Tax=Alterisphingorhabdus coralli TaxID=3071408 RepID=A0AA97F6D1_9SPHN|nr:biotin--[acetyl-CoA-carboxylase] ligase [Parasphingorhabdus sp. SCSIO 66989]WOE73932.1 biotin--[acetyl-CoA-carboxylase] ligase [Parasphingorhabdus sp. SCSIO 66989]
MLMMRRAPCSGRYNIAHSIETVAITASTNADLLLRAQQGAPEGTWLRAEQQQAGRGRLQRNWASPPGNLYISTIVRLRHDDPPPATLALVAGLAFHATAAHWFGNAAPMLKWPNDLLVNGAKLGGILLERTGDAVVAGLGMNITSAPDLPDRETIALHDMKGGKTATAEAVAEKLATSFAATLNLWRDPQRGLGAIIQEWENCAHSRGTALSVTGADGKKLGGTFDGLAPDGALRLRDGHGTVHMVNAGDVDLLVQTGND